MSGFPTRPTRDDFGPEPVNSRPVRDPSRELDGETIGRLMFHQLAGLGLGTARAWLLTQIDAGPAVSIASRTETWNPKNLSASPYDWPVVIRSGVGVYLVEYNSTYPDQTGELQAVDPKAPLAKVVPPAGTATDLVFVERAVFESAPPTGKFQIHVRTFQWQVGVSSDWAPADLPFFLGVW